jgi:hypothetical protein
MRADFKVVAGYVEHGTVFMLGASGDGSSSYRSWISDGNRDVVEDMLRTAMMGGVSPDEVEARAAVRDEELKAELARVVAEADECRR